MVVVDGIDDYDHDDDDDAADGDDDDGDDDDGDDVHDNARSIFHHFRRKSGSGWEAYGVWKVTCDV